MAESEQQQEEREVLLSIYDGDPAFKEISPTTYQYKYGVDGDPKSFLLEITWGKTYPTEKPVVNMNTFYNKHILEAVKEQVCNKVMCQAEQYLGEAMTYTLFEALKEHLSELAFDQPEASIDNSNLTETELADQDEIVTKKALVKKEQLSKSQKRKQWDRLDAKGERPRGWDWVEIVKHLSQTGSKEDSSLPSS